MEEAMGKREHLPYNRTGGKKVVKNLLSGHSTQKKGGKRGHSTACGKRLKDIR